MSRDFDDIYKKIDQSHKELHKHDNENSKSLDGLDRNQQKMMKEIADIKKEIVQIAAKVDIMLEILNNFTIMLAEDDESLEDDYDMDSDESWASKEDDFWEDDDNEVA